MTFGQEALIKIGQLFSGRDRQHDTAEIAEIIGCDEEDIWNALSDARAAYRAQADAECTIVVKTPARRHLDRPRAMVPFVGFDPTEKSWWGK